MNWASPKKISPLMTSVDSRQLLRLQKKPRRLATGRGFFVRAFDLVADFRQQVIFQVALNGGIDLLDGQAEVALGLRIYQIEGDRRRRRKLIRWPFRITIAF